MHSIGGPKTNTDSGRFTHLRNAGDGRSGPGDPHVFRPGGGDKNHGALTLLRWKRARWLAIGSPLSLSLSSACAPTHLGHFVLREGLLETRHGPFAVHNEIDVLLEGLQGFHSTTVALLATGGLVGFRLLRQTRGVLLPRWSGWIPSNSHVQLAWQVCCVCSLVGTEL